MRKLMLRFLAMTVIVGLLAQTAVADPADDAGRVVSQYRAVWPAPPRRIPANHSVDGPLMGNGDMKVALGGPAEEQRFYLAKNDMWRLKSQYGQSCPVGFGHLAIRIPELKGASYRLEQRWDAPKTVGTFVRDGLTVRMRSLVAATGNLVLIDLEADGKDVDAEALLRVASGRGSASNAARMGEVIFGQRAFVDDVDIPSGVAVAWKVIGAKTSEARSGGAAIPTNASYRVNIGREQRGSGRWGFKGTVDDLRVYGRSLSAEEINTLAGGEALEGAAHAWPMDEQPGADAPMQVVPGRVGKAWHFTGERGCFLDCGNLAIPVVPVTMACWIKIEEASEVANYILSCGEWNKGVSIGLSAGKLRFTAAGRYVESAVLPKGEWIHVGGTWDGSQLTAYVNGKEAGRAGSAAAHEGVRFTLEAGKPITLVLAMDSVFRSETYAEDVVKVLHDLPDLSDLRRAHAAWWADYWARSWVEIGEEEIEKSYYCGLYHMGACSRDPRFPPGIFGWVTTDSPAWAGDYHLNYNHMAPFYALYSANRIEQADPQDAPILDFRQRGRWYAKEVFGMRGVHYPVGVGPLGIETTRGGHSHHGERGGLFFGQRSNPAYCLVNIAQRWRTTFDPVYGKKVYPYVLEVVSFWEDYLKYEKGLGGKMRYAIYGDSIHEGSGQNMNPILSLGLIRNAFDLALDMSDELGVDANRREKWEHILGHLSSWTTQEMGGKTVFRYTEEGTAWWRNNTLGIQHIYPAGAIGLDSDPKWIQVSHNIIDVYQRWLDFNGTNSLFPAAVRVGYDPKIILEKLRIYARHSYPNGFKLNNPHGIENFSTVPNTINEMLCMSHVPVGNPDRAESVIRLFAVWPRDRDARFENIRTWGTFLVSSELKDGEVQQVTIRSERGRDCTMVNPWPGSEAKLTRRGESTTLRGERFTFETRPGETARLTVAEKLADEKDH